MNKLINFMKSELFLSLAGGFALGVAGIALVKPATAGSDVDYARSISVSTPDHESTAK
ncbi:MAG: hypothetical protein V3V15_11790 [Sphingorhabdus sp.]